MDEMKATKRCPYCGEMIMPEAKKCIHCGEWIVPKPQSVLRQEQREREEALASRSVSFDEKVENLLSSVFLYGGCLLMIAVPVAIAVCAASFVPDEAKHREAIENDAVECIKEGYSEWASTLGGEELGFLTSLFMDSNSIRSEARKVFEEHNEINVNESWFWSTGILHNRNHPDGVTVSFGMFGVVIPFVTWDDISIMDTDESENQ